MKEFFKVMRRFAVSGSQRVLFRVAHPHAEPPLQGGQDRVWIYCLGRCGTFHEGHLGQ